MTSQEIRIIRSNLSPAIGWSWPFVLLKSHARKQVLLGATRWATITGPETEFVKRIAIAPALYAELERRIGRDPAGEVMGELLVAVGCRQQWEHLNSMAAVEGGGMEWLMAFHELMDRKGAPQFNMREYVKQDETTCHFLITRCVFHDFFEEAGAPELTAHFCEVDRRFFPEAFPDFRFHRGGSWENTIAYGKDHCEFVFEKNTAQSGYQGE